MQINQISPENTPPESLHIQKLQPGQNTPGAPKKDNQTDIAKTAADESNVSALARILANESEQIAKDAEPRPEKVQLFRTQLEQGFAPSDEQIDAIWSKILGNS